MSALLIALLMNGAAPEAAAAPPAPPANVERDAGWYSELDTGMTYASAPSRQYADRFFGYALRGQLGHTFPLGGRFHLGPMLGVGAAFASVSLSADSSEFVGELQLSLSPALELDVSRRVTLAFTTGPAWITFAGGQFLGPEFSLALRTRDPLGKTRSTYGAVFRFTFLPMFELDAAASAPAYAGNFSVGFNLGPR